MDYEKDYVLGQLYKNKVNVIAPKSVEMDIMANGRIPSYLSYQNNNVVNVTDILKYFPISEYYIQFTDKSGNFLEAGQPTNWYKKMYGIDTTWELMFNTESIYFRTEGSLANSSRSSGVQGDAIREITGSLRVATALGYPSGIISVANAGVYYRADVYDSNLVCVMNIQASKQVPTASENRVINRLIRVYHLLSISGVNISDIIGG